MVEKLTAHDGGGNGAAEDRGDGGAAGDGHGGASDEHCGCFVRGWFVVVGFGSD